MIGNPVRTAVSVTVCAIALASCASMAPRYTRPQAPVPAQFRDAPAGESGARPVAALDWRQVFVDRKLRDVIALALDNNRDLRVAMLNIEQARATYRIQRAEMLPSIDASANWAAQRGSVYTSGMGLPLVSRSISAEVGFSAWELDLFGRIRSLKNEALQTWLATEQAQRSTRMSLVAEVAGDWLAVDAYRQRLALARQTLDSQRETLRLTELKHEQGVASGVDLAQVQTSVESARADVASYSIALAQARNALELVVGTPVSDELLPDEKGGEAVALAPLPVHLSSDVLLQRPDVLYAEHRLEAANADIGAARAAFFPTVSLTASAGRSSDQLSNLFNAGTRTWSFVPSISIPIFHAGALKASLDVAKIEKQIEVANYEKAIQTAFSEVADALAARVNIGERIDAQHALVAVTQRRYMLADMRWRSGVDSHLDALDAQRSLYGANQTLITLQLEEATNRVTLYKVLGGGADAQSATTAGALAQGR